MFSCPRQLIFNYLSKCIHKSQKCKDAQRQRGTRSVGRERESPSNCNQMRLMPDAAANLPLPLPPPMNALLITLCGVKVNKITKQKSSESRKNASRQIGQLKGQWTYGENGALTRPDPTRPHQSQIDLMRNYTVRFFFFCVLIFVSLLKSVHLGVLRMRV